MGNYQKYLKIILSLAIAISPIIFINSANASVGGWSMSNPVAQGASVLYDATKNVIINGKNVVKTSTALITPTATSVAKLLGKGVAGVALSVAVEQLLGAVDWVLDPTNNQIKWKEGGMIGGKYIFLCTESSNGCPLSSLMIFPKLSTSDYIQDASNLCSAYAVSLGGTKHSNSSPYSCIVTLAGKNQFYGIATRTVADQQGQEKTLPLTTVAAQVISNAESNTDKRVAAQAATTAAAADMVKDAESDNVKARPIVNQLEENSKIETDADSNTATGSQTQNPTKPETTDLKLEFPKFCGWAPIVCEAAQSAIKFPTSVAEYWEIATKSMSQTWTEAKEWATTETKTETKLDLETPSQDNQPNTSINFSSECPSKIPLVFSWNGATLDFSFDFTIWCNAIGTYVKPVVIALGSLHALYIVSGVRQDG